MKRQHSPRKMAKFEARRAARKNAKAGWKGYTPQPKLNQYGKPYRN